MPSTSTLASPFDAWTTLYGTILLSSLISENFRASGRVDFEAGLLLPARVEQGEPVEDIVEPAIEKAIEQSATAMVVRHHDDLVPLGGIGAVLRF